MQTKLLVPVLAAGLALSASVFGQNANADVGWTRSTAADSMTGANTYSPNTYRAEKSQAREQEKFQHHEQQTKNAGSAVTRSQAGSAKMHQPARAAGTNLQWFEDVVNPRMAAANWRAEEGD
jgi:hypothetical protein